jgi:hypothetical protein
MDTQKGQLQYRYPDKRSAQNVTNHKLQKNKAVASRRGQVHRRSEPAVNPAQPPPKRARSLQKKAQNVTQTHTLHLALDLCNSPWLAVGRRCSRCVNIDLQNRLTSIHVKTG